VKIATFAKPETVSCKHYETDKIHNMNVKEAYKNWSQQYDTNINKTRDLEAISLRDLLSEIKFEKCLEIGCGTGKNTEWLVTKGNYILAVDISDEMLSIAKQKITDKSVSFIKADLSEKWDFTSEKFDLIVCSLVLEHIENINTIIKQISQHLINCGILYIGELHPFKQYTGSKPKFETEEGEQIVTAFTHHISDFTNAAKDHGLEIEIIKEYFDNNDRSNPPRILSLKFKKVIIY
jgi:2-polyprenyl-3-methyl-5-hydroxy-6-metoxy-1,4-benzoquinol methylase